MPREWEKPPSLIHLPAGAAREMMERRRRLRAVRYLLYRLRTDVEAGRPAGSSPANYPPGFIGFWPMQKPEYGRDPSGKRIPPRVTATVAEIGGYAQFASRWDVDADLIVYLRHSSVWQEWAATLARVVPVLGE